MSEHLHEPEERAKAHIRGGARRAIARRHVFGHLAGATAVLGLVERVTDLAVGLPGGGPAGRPAARSA